ncbi:hypothetical protein QQF64_035670 [Cirrhinus molitorella]|uniref:Uncharacterized protein n=1 Tax=Cirrhinus molitorella TaxID=172907 RepID=A0ABR3NGE0_9TELE
MFLKPELSDSVQLFVSAEACVPKTKNVFFTPVFHVACGCCTWPVFLPEHPPNPHVSSFLFSPFLLTTAGVMKHQSDPAGNLRNFCLHEERISALDSGRKLESDSGLQKNPPYRRTLLSSVSLGSRLHGRTVLLQQTSAC